VERSLGQTEAHALVQVIRQCRLCADRFAATATAHRPRPLPWFNPTARLLIAGQAPGLRVHESGRPFTDASGAAMGSAFAASDRLGRRILYFLALVFIVIEQFRFFQGFKHMQRSIVQDSS
jgi:uracil-DNA glycosylase